MKTVLKLLFLLFITTGSGIGYAQTIDPDTGEVMEEVEEEENTGLSEKEQELLDKMIKLDRHKPFRLRTSFSNQFASLDASDIGADKAYTLALDIPTFTIYKELYIDIRGFVSGQIFSDDVVNQIEQDYLIIYGASANFNYSLKIIDGLYIVPFVGYGLIQSTNLELDIADIDPSNPEAVNLFAFTAENEKNGTHLNYGVFLDFSFTLKSNGIGLTAGFSNFNKFTVGIQF
ncbi:hypothetical protein [Aequorivita capsosiphonis]|uniref:hypothetical protein n=1 Tax=Aequorivita capsosiphonis TaxID=487317 RepID=UPI000416E38D|nr:hypothetical protein [Aequorivita capsosiphonis]